VKRIRQGDPLCAVAYIRVSTEEQHLGPEAQRAAIASWAAKGGVRVAATHSDTLTGASELVDRPGLVEALSDLTLHHAGVLVVAKRDRLARDVVIAATIERAVAKHGARVIAADGVGNGDSPADGFMRVILDGAAAYERALIRARTKVALQALRARGQRAGTIPFGYFDAGNGKLAPDPAEQVLVARVRALREGGASLRAMFEQVASARGFGGLLELDPEAA